MSFTETATAFAHVTARGLEVVGVALIIIGALLACAMFARQLVKALSAEQAYRQFRMQLGRAILIGLEFLVAADIIGTVAVEPTFTSLGVLALIVLIRTFLSFSLEVEITGRWPWQAQRDHTGT